MALFLLNFVNKNLNCCWTPEKLIPNYYHHPTQASYCKFNTPCMFASISLSLHIHCTVLITTNTGHWCSKSRKHTATSLYQWFLHMWQHLPEGLISAFAPPEVRWTSSLCWSITKLSHRTSLQIFTNTICSAWLTEHYKELSFLYLNYRVNRPVCLLSCSLRVHTFFPLPSTKWL